MATLTEVSVIARKGVKYGFIALVVMALIPGTIGLIKKIYLTLNPPPPPPPTVRYGKLPPLVFPEAPNFATPEYKLETISGGLPALPNTGKVYAVGINKSRLLTLDRMQTRATSLGFVNEPVQLDERTYRFSYPAAPIDMIFDVISGAISYKFDWTRDNTIAKTFNVPIGDAAVSGAKAFFNRLGAMPEDLNTGDSQIKYLVATGSAMMPAASAYEANFVRVDLFRANKDQSRIVTVGGDTSPVNIILTAQSRGNNVIQANYYYSQILDGDFATYPLEPVTAAWASLQAGGGFIAKRTTLNQIVIRRVTLAYFESNEPQKFFQPVYVFEGDNGFLAYMPAVAKSYLIQ